METMRRLLAALLVAALSLFTVACEAGEGEDEGEGGAVEQEEGGEEDG